MLDLLWCHERAELFLKRRGLADAPRVTREMFMRKCGLVASTKAPKGCTAGALQGVIYEPARGGEAFRAENFNHEGGHVIDVLTRDPGDELCTPEAAMRWLGVFGQIPAASAAYAARVEGYDPAAIVARFEGLNPVDVMTRVALATGARAVFVAGRKRAQYVANDVDDDELNGEMHANVAALAARALRHTIEAGEWVAGPVNDNGRGVIVAVHRGRQR